MERRVEWPRIEDWRRLRLFRRVGDLRTGIDGRIHHRSPGVSIGIDDFEGGQKRGVLVACQRDEGVGDCFIL